MKTQMRCHDLSRRRLEQFSHLILPTFRELRERRPLHRSVVETIDAGKERRSFPLRQSSRRKFLDRAQQRSPLFSLHRSVSEHDILTPADFPTVSSTADTSFLVTSASHIHPWPADSLPLPTYNPRR